MISFDLADGTMKYFLVGVTVIVAGLFSYRVYEYYHKNKSEEVVIRQNVMGNQKPETYIEQNGVRYFSHIDGKEISDLVK